jgi:hypothetical protein
VSPETANYVGFAGMALIVSAYAYVTASRAVNPFVLHGMNLVGAALLILSLTVNRNLPSMVLESVWAAVALFGLGKALLSPSRLREGLGVGESMTSSAATDPPPTPPASGRGE